MARAAIVVLFYAAGIYFGYVSLYMLSWLGLGVLLFAVVLGPYGAAWVACHLVPAGRDRLVKLTVGTVAGLILVGMAASVTLKALHQRCRCAVLDENAWLAHLLVAAAIGVPWLGGFTVAHWSRRNPESEESS